MEASGLVIPSEIPWADLTGESLEELVFWLCDAMGAKDLQWRIGSVGGPTSDQGRDIQAVFHVPTPDGELQPEAWWLQAKGRARTVESEAVKSAVLDAQGEKPDVLVIATNSRFSNPTRNWIREFQRQHPRPIIRLWDREALERLIVRNPSVAIRIVPGALSSQGTLAAIVARFWDRLEYPNAQTLGALWRKRETLEIDWRSLWALLAGEFASGDIQERSWGAGASEATVDDALVLGLANLLGWTLRAQEAGVNDDAVFDAATHVVALALLHASPERVVAVLRNPWQHVEPPEGRVDRWDPDRLQRVADLLMKPIVGQLRTRLGDVCAGDCVRIDAEIDPPERPSAAFWDQFIQGSGPADTSETQDRLVIETLTAPCRAGLDLGESDHCPLFAEEPWEDAVPKYALILRARVAGRISTAEG